MSGLADLDQRIEVRFNGLRAIWANLLLLPPIWLLLHFPFYVGYLFLIPLCAGFAIGLFFILATFDRRPLMVIAPEGIHVPAAGDLFLPYDEIETWVDKSRSHRPRWESHLYTLSLQGRPRIHVELGWWARLRRVESNGLLGGDLLFEQRFIDVDVERLAAMIQARIDRATAA
jgi:hypothetical protein